MSILRGCIILNVLTLCNTLGSCVQPPAPHEWEPDAPRYNQISIWQEVDGCVNYTLYVASYVTDTDNVGFCKMSASALFQGFEINLVLRQQEHVQQVGILDRIHAYYTFLQRLPTTDNTLVVFVDAYDIFFLDSPAELVQRFARIRTTKILYSAERGCSTDWWEHAKAVSQGRRLFRDQPCSSVYPPPPSGSPAPFLNAGAVVAFRREMEVFLYKAIRQYDETTALLGAFTGADDQCLLSQLYSDGISIPNSTTNSSDCSAPIRDCLGISLDVHSRIFMNMYLVDIDSEVSFTEDGKVSFAEHRTCEHLTGSLRSLCAQEATFMEDISSSPVILHFSGASKRSIATVEQHISPITYFNLSNSSIGTDRGTDLSWQDSCRPMLERLTADEPAIDFFDLDGDEVVPPWRFAVGDMSQLLARTTGSPAQSLGVQVLIDGFPSEGVGALAPWRRAQIMSARTIDDRVPSRCDPSCVVQLKVLSYQASSGSIEGILVESPPRQLVRAARQPDTRRARAQLGTEPPAPARDAHAEAVGSKTEFSASTPCAGRASVEFFDLVGNQVVEPFRYEVRNAHLCAEKAEHEVVVQVSAHGRVSSVENHVADSRNHVTQGFAVRFEELPPGQYSATLRLLSMVGEPLGVESELRDLVILTAEEALAERFASRAALQPPRACPPHDLTLLLALSTRRSDLARLSELAHSWDGPLSAAVRVRFAGRSSRHAADGPGDDGEGGDAELEELSRLHAQLGHDAPACLTISVLEDRSRRHDFPFAALFDLAARQAETPMVLMLSPSVLPCRELGLASKQGQLSRLASASQGALVLPIWHDAACAVAGGRAGAAASGLCACGRGESAALALTAAEMDFEPHLDASIAMPRAGLAQLSQAALEQGRPTHLAEDLCYAWSAGKGKFAVVSAPLLRPRQPPSAPARSDASSQGAQRSWGEARDQELLESGDSEGGQGEEAAAAHLRSTEPETRAIDVYTTDHGFISDMYLDMLGGIRRSCNCVLRLTTLDASSADAEFSPRSIVVLGWPYAGPYLAVLRRMLAQDSAVLASLGLWYMGDEMGSCEMDQQLHRSVAWVFHAYWRSDLVGLSDISYLFRTTDAAPGDVDATSEPLPATQRKAAGPRGHSKCVCGGAGAQGMPEKLKGCPRGQFWVPLGTFRHSLPESVRIPMRQRRLLWSFAGSVNRKPERGRMLELLRQHPRWASDLNPRGRMVSFPTFEEATRAHAAQRDYTAMLGDTQYMLCPGGVHAETFRLWEALDAGAIPVSVYQEGLQYVWELRLGVVWLRDWEELPDFLLAATMEETEQRARVVERRMAQLRSSLQEHLLCAVCSLGH